VRAVENQEKAPLGELGNLAGGRFLATGERNLASQIAFGGADRSAQRPPSFSNHPVLEGGLRPMQYTLTRSAVHAHAPQLHPSS
jgi:hypothetical protein